MSQWFDGRIITKDELDLAPPVTPSSFQIGSPCKLWVYNDDGSCVGLPARIAGVHIGRAHMVTYDLAFEIAGTNTYAVVSKFRGYITQPEVMHPSDVSMDNRGGLHNAPSSKPKKTKPVLSVVQSTQQTV